MKCTHSIIQGRQRTCFRGIQKQFKGNSNQYETARVPYLGRKIHFRIKLKFLNHYIISWSLIFLNIHAIIAKILWQNTFVELHDDCFILYICVHSHPENYATDIIGTKPLTFFRQLNHFIFFLINFLIS